jgi:PAS domain S-box-containing protein
MVGRQRVANKGQGRTINHDPSEGRQPAGMSEKPAETRVRPAIADTLIQGEVERLKLTEAALKSRLEFESLLTDISARFVNLPVELIDNEIEDAQRRICEHLELDLCVLWRMSPENEESFILTHLYRPLGGPPPPDPMRAEEHFPWCVEQLRAGNTIIISSYEDMPQEATRDKEVSRHFGVKASLGFPLSAGGGPLFGVLTFNDMRRERVWQKELVNRLQLVANIFGNALARRRSEMALRESEERLRLAAVSAGVGLWKLDLRTGLFWATARGLELFGFAADHRLCVDEFLDVVHPEDRDLVLRTVREATQSDDDFRVEYRIIRNNSIRWIISRGRRQLSDVGEPGGGLMGVSADITDRKMNEAMTEEAQSLVSAIVESTKDMIWSVDPQRFGLLTFNSALSDYFRRGIGLEITKGMSPDDMVKGLFTPTVAERWRQFYLRSLREGPFSEEYRTSSGTRVLLLSFNLLKRAGEVFAISVFGRDVTERRLMEKEIRLAAREWQVTFDAIPDMVMILDKESTILHANAAVGSYLNLPMERIPGSRCYTLMHGEGPPPQDCPVTTMMKTPRHVERDRYDNERQKWFHISVDPVLDEKGEVIRIVHTVKDITETKRVVAQAFDHRRELLRMERVLRMGELTASLAHELNQPLTSILSNARAALRFIDSGKADIDELKEILIDIAHDDKRAGDIIRSVRSMVRPQESELALISVNDILREAVALFHSEAIIRNINVKTILIDPLPKAYVEATQIRQVVVNLMMNAAESMLNETENRKIIVSSAQTEGNRVRVAVRDFGSGIEDGDIDKLFEPFFTTKRSGLGMGLSLSRSIVEAHGGHIRAVNNPDKGTTFYFDLPVAEE